MDIFAASPVEDSKAGSQMLRRSSDTPQANTTFAVGEEAEQPRPVMIRDVGNVAAPIDASGAVLEPGSTVRVDVVVRTRKIGHFFPGGTVDAFDVWLELQAKDADGRVIFWSGNVEDGGKGPVEPGAHFYRSYQLDGEGNPINKRNAWQARSVLYVRLIPPGAADVAHYRVQVPKDAKGPHQFTAKLNYRKFTRYYTQFAYAGEPQARPGSRAAGQRPTTACEYEFPVNAIPANVSGKIKGRIPDLPIVYAGRGHRDRAPGQADVEAGGPQAGSRALERLGHRPAAARRPERRRVRLPEGHRGRARLCRRLAERGARADSGRRDRSRQAVHRKGDVDQPQAGPQLVLQGR